MLSVVDRNVGMRRIPVVNVEIQGGESLNGVWTPSEDVPTS
jgi:hypothetical protein